MSQILERVERLIIIHGIEAKLVSNWEKAQYLPKASNPYVEKGYLC